MITNLAPRPAFPLLRRDWNARSASSGRYAVQRAVGELIDGYENITNSYAGMTAGAEVGNVLRVIAGTGRGQLRKITANTSTQLSWDLPLVLDATSVWIVEAPAWGYTADSAAIDNADPSHAVTLNVPTDNFINQALVIAGFTVDVNGNESPDGDNPIREDWVFGLQGVRVVTANDDELPTDGTVKFDSSAGPITFQCLPAAAHLNAEIFYVKESSDTNPVTVNAAAGEAFTDGTTSFTLINAGDNQGVKWHG